MNRINSIRKNIKKQKINENQKIPEIPFHKLQRRKWLSLSEEKNEKKLRIMTYNILANSNVFHFLYKNHSEEDLNNEIRMGKLIKFI